MRGVRKLAGAACRQLRKRLGMAGCSPARALAGDESAASGGRSTVQRGRLTHPPPAVGVTYGIAASSAANTSQITTFRTSPSSSSVDPGSDRLSVIAGITSSAATMTHLEPLLHTRRPVVEHHADFDGTEPMPTSPRGRQNPSRPTKRDALVVGPAGWAGGG